jgi:hypothetical protein
VGRARPYRPRDAHTVAIAHAVRDDILPDLARAGIKPNGRQTFYILFTKHLLDKDEKAYKRWRKQSEAMRKGGWIPMDAFIDGTRHRHGGGGGRVRPCALLLAVASNYSINPWLKQPVVGELWCEAETHYELFTPLAAEFRVALVPTHGNPSISLLHESAQVINRRYSERGQTTQIVYCGDHDPKGVDMSLHLHERLVEVHMIPEACRVVRAAVTREQIHHLGLPTSRPKKSDPLTPWYERMFPGLGCTEHQGPCTCPARCAELDAIPPRALIAIVRERLEATISDREAWETRDEEEAEVRQRVVDFLDENAVTIDGVEEGLKWDEEGQTLYYCGWCGGFHRYGQSCQGAD